MYTTLTSKLEQNCLNQMLFVSLTSQELLNKLVHARLRMQPMNATI